MAHAVARRGYVYDGSSKKIKVSKALSTSDVPTLTQNIAIVKAFVNKLAPMNLGRYAFRIPTLLELRMLFARLGRITEVELELMNQGLITHPIATLFNYGENALSGLGGVVLSSTKLGVYHMGMQGLSARFVGVANTSSIIPPVNMYCIPFFRFTSDMFV